MRKLITCIILAITLVSYKQAGAQQLKFYYYPNSNVYYDVANRNYVHFNNGNWQTVRVLPSGIRVNNTPRYVVYHSTPQVWVGNSKHKVKYQNRPNGRAVGYYKHKGRGNGKWKNH